MEVIKIEKQVGTTIGRPCCGNRLMKIRDAATSSWSDTKFLETREFKGWECSVNWFFLHIEQHTNSVFFHQTCQATFEGPRGPISSLDDFDSFIDMLETRLETGERPSVTCTKQTCGCGLCAPKSCEKDMFHEVISSHLISSNSA